MEAYQWQFPHPFIHQIEVQEADIDGLGHANNACYVRWCEDTAWAHSHRVGVGLDQFHALDRAMAVRKADYDYRFAAYAGERLLIATWITDISAAQMTRYFQFVREADSTTILLAKWLLVCIEISSGKPKRLPVEFKAAYGNT